MRSTIANNLPICMLTTTIEISHC